MTTFKNLFQNHWNRNLEESIFGWRKFRSIQIKLWHSREYILKTFKIILQKHQANFTQTGHKVSLGKGISDTRYPGDRLDPWIFCYILIISEKFISGPLYNATIVMQVLTAKIDLQPFSLWRRFFNRTSFVDNRESHPRLIFFYLFWSSVVCRLFFFFLIIFICSLRNF